MPDSSELVGRLLTGSDDVQLSDAEFAQLTAYLKHARLTPQELTGERFGQHQKLKRIRDVNRELRIATEAKQATAMTVGELLQELGGIEGLEIRAVELQKLVRGGPYALEAGSREAAYALEAARLSQTASRERDDLYRNPDVDALRATAAAETGQSRLSLQFVQKLAGSLAQQESIGYEAVRERCVGELLGRGFSEPMIADDDKYAYLDDLNRIEKEMPILNKQNGEWLKAAEAAQFDEITRDSLNTMRGKPEGKVNMDGTFGIDKAGRRWRKEPDKPRTIWYYKPSLRKYQAV